MGAMKERDVVTVAEAAAILGITPRAVQKRIEAGHLQAEKITKRLFLLSRSDVEQAREQGRLHPGPKPGRPRRPTSSGRGGGAA